MQPNLPIAEKRPQRPLALQLSINSRLRLEALETILQQKSTEIIDSALVALLSKMPESDRQLVDTLVNRASKAIADSQQTISTAISDLKLCHTVGGKEFRYRGSLADGVEVVFNKSQPLRITRVSVDHITSEIRERRGPALMGAIFAPLMPNSIGEAIYRKYGLSPINLSYVVPLLREEGRIRAFKDGRNWYVEGINQSGL